MAPNSSICLQAPQNFHTFTGDLKVQSSEEMFFFLENARELRLIILRRMKGAEPYTTHHTQPHTNPGITFAPDKGQRIQKKCLSCKHQQAQLTADNIEITLHFK